MGWSGLALRIALAVLVVAPALITTASGDTCPLSCVFDICSTLPRNSHTRHQPTILGRDAEGTAEYDLVAGFVGAWINSGGDGSMNVAAQAADRFMLVGPPSPIPVSFKASFHVAAGSASLHGGANGTIEDANGALLRTSAPYFDPACGCARYFVDQVLLLSIQHPVGELFELTYAVGASASGVSETARATGTLSFTDLPPGHGIVSCQGFMAGAPVPVQRTSWGNLKVIYR